MKVNELFEVDYMLSLFWALLFFFSMVLFLSDDDPFRVLFLFHAFFSFVVWAVCQWGDNKYSKAYLKQEKNSTGKIKYCILLEDAKQKKYWKAALLKNIIEAAEFLAITVWGAFLVMEAEKSIYETAGFAVAFLLLPARLMLFAPVVCYLSNYRPKREKADKKQSRRKECPLFGFYFSEDGKNAYGNLRQE